MRVFVSGGSGVQGHAAVPLLECAGHRVMAPERESLDLFNPEAVTAWLSGSDAILHLATRIPPSQLRGTPHAWVDNDRLRADATRTLVDAGISSGATMFILPTVAFVYPREGPADETTSVKSVPAHLRSALAAEREVARFAGGGRRGVVLRMGLLYGPGTGIEEPGDVPLHIVDAGGALLAGLGAPSGLYNVVADGARVSNRRFKETTGWRPQH